MIRRVLGWVYRRHGPPPPTVHGTWLCPGCGTSVVLTDGDPLAVAAALDDARERHVCTSPDSS